MSVINTNVLSLVAQQNLNQSRNDLTTAMERLSSGLRINSAKDDAAGQAIANRFTSQINGLNQAVRNANDGISIAQTTEGALNQINDNLQSIRTLVVQAENGSNSASDLQSIQDEIGQRLAEIDRISEETDFNGVRVLAEGADDLRVQVGANDGQIINIGLRNIDVTSLGLSGFNVDGGGAIQNAGATVTNVENAGGVQNPSGGGDWAVVTTHRAATFEDAFANMQDGNTVTIGSGGAAAGNVYTFNEATGDFSFTDTSNVDITSATSGGTAFAQAQGMVPNTGEIAGVYELAGGDRANFTVDANGAVLIDGEQARITAAGELTVSSGGGTLATIGELVATVASGGAGRTMTINDTVYTSSAFSGGISFTNTATSAQVENALDNATSGSSIVLGDGFAAATINFVSGGSTSNDTFVDADNELTTLESFRTEYNINAETGEVTIHGVYDATGDGQTTVQGTKYDEDVGATVYVSGGTLTTSPTTPGDRTEAPLAMLDEAIADVDSLRSELGAVQNRFLDAINNLTTSATNLSDARSRIEDADYAKEVAEMTRAQILQQAGTSVLAQANQLPQNVLSLLG